MAGTFETPLTHATKIGKKALRKTRKTAGRVANAKKDDGDRNPRDGADGAQDLHHRIDYLIQRRIPAQGQAQGDSHNGCRAESKGNAAQRITDVGPKHMLVQQLGQTLFHA